MHKFCKNLMALIVLQLLCQQSEGARGDFELDFKHDDSLKRIRGDKNLTENNPRIFGIFDLLYDILSYDYDEDEEDNKFLICQNCTVEVQGDQSSKDKDKEKKKEEGVKEDNNKEEGDKEDDKEGGDKTEDNKVQNTNKKPASSTSG